MLFIDRAH